MYICETGQELHRWFVDASKTPNDVKEDEENPLVSPLLFGIVPPSSRPK